MNKIQALNNFWTGFTWNAYDASSVPEDVPYQHISFEVASDEFGNSVALTANLWDRSTSWEALTLKEMEISDYIGRGGLIVTYDDGAMWIKKGSPWAQRLADTEETKRIVLNIEVEFLD